MTSYKKQIGCAFIFENQEWIYEGIDHENHNIDCAYCGRQLKGTAHLFNSADGYNDCTYESRWFGSECIKHIIQAGYHK